MRSFYWTGSFVMFPLCTWTTQARRLWFRSTEHSIEQCFAWCQPYERMRSHWRMQWSSSIFSHRYCLHCRCGAFDHEDVYLYGAFKEEPHNILFNESKEPPPSRSDLRSNHRLLISNFAIVLDTNFDSKVIQSVRNRALWNFLKRNFLTLQWWDTPIFPVRFYVSSSVKA